MGANNIKKEVGRRVRQFREEKGWSQEELGYRCGLHRNYIGGIERGERNVAIENLQRIAKAFGVTPSRLVP